MTRNVGGIDRAARIVIGLGLVALALTHKIGVWGYLGAVPALSGIAGWCPAYLPFGWKTCGTK